MPYGNDIGILRYVQKNSAGEIRRIKCVQAGVKLFRIRSRAGLFEEPSVPAKSEKYLTQLSATGDSAARMYLVVRDMIDVLLVN